MGEGWVGREWVESPAGREVKIEIEVGWGGAGPGLVCWVGCVGGRGGGGGDRGEKRGGKEGREGKGGVGKRLDWKRVGLDGVGLDCAMTLGAGEVTRGEGV